MEAEEPEAEEVLEELEVLAVDLPVELEVVQLVEPEEPEVPVELVELELVPEAEPVVLELEEQEPEELEERDQICLTSLLWLLICCTSTIGAPYQFFLAYLMKILPSSNRKHYTIWKML